MRQGVDKGLKWHTEENEDHVGQGEAEDKDAVRLAFVVLHYNLMVADEVESDAG